MKKMILMVNLLLIFAGCDTFRGPFLSNSTEKVLVVEVEMENGDTVETILSPAGKMPLGGHRGGNDPAIHMIRVYDEKERCIKVIRKDEYGEKDTIIVE